MKRSNYIYLVEGQDEEKLVRVLYSLGLIVAGKPRVLNVTTHRISQKDAMALGECATVILVFDTDRDAAILRENIRFLQKKPNVRKVLCIPQVQKLEHELVRSCDIKYVSEITHSRTDAEFKADFIKLKNPDQRLRAVGFDMDKFWRFVPAGEFAGIPNNSDKIRIKRK